MKRRTFIESTLCLGCMGFLASGCDNLFESQKSQEDKFVYKSKKDLPRKIRIEACSLCQLKCPGCKIRNTAPYMPKDWLGTLKFSDFKNFLDDNEYIEEIEIANKGEIFLNPELDEIIKYAYEKNVKLTAINGVNLNSVSDTTLENLVKYRFKEMNVALDGATPETYKIYRVGGDYNTVIKNIEKINYFKEKYKSKYPKLVWQFIPFGHNEHEIELAKKKAKELNMKIFFLQNYSPKYSPVKNKELVEKQTGLKLSASEEESIKEQCEIYCLPMFKSPKIDYDGRLICRTKGNKSFGTNVFKDGYLNALNSPDFIYAKRMLTDLSVEPKPNLVCSECKRFRKLRKHNLTISIK